MTDWLGFIILVIGFTTASTGFVWLLSRAFQSDQRWATLVLLFPAFTPFYLLATLRRTWAPGLTIILGAGIVAGPFVLKKFSRHFIDLGERVRTVDGEVHVTLTGWDRTDYSILEKIPDAQVVQMANPDVTDQTLKWLEKMDQLRELDLNDSAITDEGLSMLRQLPKLQQLRLRGTRITDAGFRLYLMPLENLRNVEVSGTEVKSATLREWKKLKTGRDYLN